MRTALPSLVALPLLLAAAGCSDLARTTKIVADNSPMMPPLPAAAEQPGGGFVPGPGGAPAPRPAGKGG
ncbi:MAG: hypothetical protein HY744_21500 [Deltaproteobacteria bacterium]|nr:hypothetical protein [Deltaproteobacteria bacterium]